MCFEQWILTSTEGLATALLYSYYKILLVFGKSHHKRSLKMQVVSATCHCDLLFSLLNCLVRCLGLKETLSQLKTTGARQTSPIWKRDLQYFLGYHGDESTSQLVDSTCNYSHRRVPSYTSHFPSFKHVNTGIVFSGKDGLGETC